MERPASNQGYAEEAAKLFQQYESTPFADVHRQFLHLIPTEPGLVLDIGAGTGRDAAALAAMGHRVLAVEPTAEFRERAAILHPSPRIEWLDDWLPDLPLLMRRGQNFDLVMLSAVWMHLDKTERERAMANVARLMKPGAVAIVSLRHGPVPSGRRMFDVTAEETEALAAANGLDAILTFKNQPARLGQPGVSWTRMALAKRG